MAEIDRIKRNVKKLIGAGAPEQDIDSYLETEGVTAADLRGEQGAIEGSISSFGGGFNIGLAKVAGLPVDVVAGVLNLIPGVDIEDPVGGSESIQRFLAEAGMTVPPGEKLQNEFVGRVGEEIGAAIVPFGIAGSIARTGATGGKYGAPLLEAFRQSPRANAAAELSAAGGAGLGGAIAQQVAPQSEGAEMAGQLVGGLLNPTALVSDVARPAGRGVRRALEPLTPGGAKRMAARQLGNVVENPERAASILRQPRQGVPGARLTPAQETGDRGLLQLERSLARADPRVGDQIDDAAGATVRATRRAADDLAPGSRAVPREFLEERIQQINTALDDRIKQAAQRARERIEQLAPATPREQINRIAREEIETALRAARAQESAVWDNVPKDAPVDTRGLKQTFQRLKASLPKAQSDDLPEVAARLLSGDDLSDVDTLKEVQGLRSKLLEVSRNARAGDNPNFNKARLADELQEAALEAMEQSAAGPEIQDALRVSRTINEKFRQGPVGKILGMERRGGAAVPPEQTLERVLTREGPEGGVNLDALMRAVDESPDARQAASDFLRQRFVMQATDDKGVVKPGVAGRFLRQNKEALDRLPEVRQELQSAKSTQDLAERTKSTMLNRKRSILDKRKSRAALFLDGRPEQEIRKVLTSRDPAGNMRQLVRQARKDGTGGALQGLKAQFIDEMMAQARTRGDDLSAESLQRFFENNQSIIRESGLFKPDEAGRIKQIVDTMQKVRGVTAGGRRIDEILDESPDALTDLVARIVGANIGAQGAAGTTGAPLVAAGAGSRFVRNLTNRIPISKTRDVLAQAVMDRDLMHTLLTKVRTPEQAQRLQRRLNAWLVNLLPEEDDFQEEGNQQLAQ